MGKQTDCLRGGGNSDFAYLVSCQKMYAIIKTDTSEVSDVPEDHFTWRHVLHESLQMLIVVPRLH